ncbi:cyclin-like protein [Lipomyces arxii]|uniref:cyclin-like protein n=1 Tax=Lipomyces arxii TaxID=56418 RepID=UPI0034CEA741
MVYTDDDLYRQGSQYRLWSFQREELDNIRHRINLKAIAKLRKELAEQDVDSGVEFLNAEEEYDLVTYYCGKAQDLAGVYKLPSHIKATAIAYIKRFYLKYSVMDYHPKNIMYTCLFLATKAENHFISIDKFAEPLPKVTPESILELEFTVAQALSFTLLIHHAFNAIHGYFLDIQTLFSDRIDQIGSAHDSARKLVNDSLFSDAVLLFTPPQIALAALSMANDDLINDYLRVKFSNQSILFEKLSQTINKIKPYIDDGAEKLKLPKERVMQIDKKLYFCRNPDKLKKRKANGIESNQQDKKMKLESSPDTDVNMS